MIENACENLKSDKFIASFSTFKLIYMLWNLNTPSYSSLALLHHSRHPKSHRWSSKNRWIICPRKWIPWPQISAGEVKDVEVKVKSIRLRPWPQSEVRGRLHWPSEVFRFKFEESVGVDSSGHYRKWIMGWSDRPTGPDPSSRLAGNFRRRLWARKMKGVKPNWSICAHGDSHQGLL